MHASFAASRTTIDQAVGVLIGLRGCTADAAFAELAAVVKQTGIGLGSLAAGLVAVASNRTSADHVDAFNIWGDLITRQRTVPNPVAAVNLASEALPPRQL